MGLMERLHFVIDLYPEIMILRNFSSFISKTPSIILIVAATPMDNNLVNNFFIYMSSCSEGPYDAASLRYLESLLYIRSLIVIV